MLACDLVSDLGDLVPRSADLDNVLAQSACDSYRREAGAHHTYGQTRPLVDLAFAFLLFSRRTSREVGLMLLALRVRQVRSLVGVERETESTFDAAQVVAQDLCDQ